MVSSQNSNLSDGAKKDFFGIECVSPELSWVQNFCGPPGWVWYSLPVAAYHVMQRNTTCHNTFYPNSQWLLTLQVVFLPRISTTILSVGSHSPPGRSHLPLGLPATWWQLAITLLLLRPPAPPESQVMRWLWFPEPSPGRWNAIFHCHR